MYFTEIVWAGEGGIRKNPGSSREGRQIENLFIIIQTFMTSIAKTNKMGRKGKVPHLGRKNKMHKSRIGDGSTGSHMKRVYGVNKPQDKPVSLVQCDGTSSLCHSRLYQQKYREM